MGISTVFTPMCIDAEGWLGRFISCDDEAEAIEVLVYRRDHLKVPDREQWIERRTIIIEQITFGGVQAVDSQLIEVFEPHASSWQERIKCLKYAYEREFQTSVSAEPLLGGESMAEQVYQETIPYITDTLWFGFLNKFDQRILEDEHVLYGGWALGMWKEYIAQYITYETAAYCASLAYLNPIVRLKDSMVKMLREDRPYVIID